MSGLARKPAGNQHGADAVRSSPTLDSIYKLSAYSRAPKRRGNDKNDQFRDETVLFVMPTHSCPRYTDDAAIRLGDEGCTVRLSQDCDQALLHGFGRSRVTQLRHESANLLRVIKACGSDFHCCHIQIGPSVDPSG